MATPSSAVRQRPTASKFSSASPIGSMILWHAGAGRIRPVLLDALAHRVGRAGGRLLLERRHVGRRQRRRAAEQVLEDPLAADHRRRPVRVRRDQQQAAVPEQTATGIALRPARAGSPDRRRSECRSAWPAARSRTCSRRRADRAPIDLRGRRTRRASPFPAGSPDAGCRRNRETRSRRDWRSSARADTATGWRSW